MLKSFLRRLAGNAASAQQLAARVPVWLVPIEEFLRRPMLGHLGEPVAIVIAKLATGRVLNLKEPLPQLLRLLRAGSVRVPVYADLSVELSAPIRPGESDGSKPIPCKRHSA